jgi:hypothetical protein
MHYQAVEHWQGSKLLFYRTLRQFRELTRPQRDINVGPRGRLVLFLLGTPRRHSLPVSEQSTEDINNWK